MIVGQGPVVLAGIGWRLFDFLRVFFLILYRLCQEMKWLLFFFLSFFFFFFLGGGGGGGGSGIFLQHTMLFY